MGAIGMLSAVRQRAAILLVLTVILAGCDGVADPNLKGNGDESTNEVPQIPGVRIEPVTETNVTGEVGTEVTPVPAVRAVDENGGPLQGVEVQFGLPDDDGGHIVHAVVETDENGVATSETWTLGHVVGAYTLNAISEGVIRAVFTATAAPGPATSMVTANGNNQSSYVGRLLPEILQTRVSDQYGNAVPGAVVTFAVVEGGGSVERSSAIAGPDGLASAGQWTLGPIAGVQQVRAETKSVTMEFSATARAIPTLMTGLRGKVAFVSERDGNPDVYVVDTEADQIERLTFGGGDDDAPAWAPDGLSLAFSSERSGSRDIYTMDADGSNLRRTTAMGSAYTPEWSPDGSRLAFAAVGHPGSLNVYTVPMNGDVTDATRIVGLPGVDAEPAWSPDGKRIAFASDYAAYDFAYDIYTADVDGSSTLQLTRGFGTWPTTRYYSHPAWSPDGSMLAVVRGELIEPGPGHDGGEHDMRDVRFTITIMSDDGAPVRDLAWGGDISWRKLLDLGSLAWSPDGNGIAYSFVDCDLAGNNGCPNERLIKYVSIDGSEQGTIVFNGHSPTWRE